MKALVTGGAGFIGRWVVKELIDRGCEVYILDDLSNGSQENVREFEWKGLIEKFVMGDIQDAVLVGKLFEEKFDVCYHLAASINVQDSIDNPINTFNNDVLGTFYILEACRKHGTKLIFMSTCMVYDKANSEKGIDETHPVKPASPYAGSKIAGENIVLSYWYAYGLPVVVVRPFNTYGPYQKSSGEGGVVSIFIGRNLESQELNIKGTGEQTRDLLYVEDCARFVVEAGFSNKANGQIVNAGSGSDVSINELARIICKDESRIKHIAHDHPQSEIMKLLCNYNKAKDILGWEPRVDLEEGIKKTEEWLKGEI